MWFEPISSWFVALLASGIPWLSEKTKKTLPAEYWANKELHHKDIMAGVSAKEIVRRAEAGRYYIPKERAQTYPTPHREQGEAHKITIENDELYKADVARYGAYRTQKWVEQGKYNLNADEKKTVEIQAQKKYRYYLTQFDSRNTEAAQRWQKAHDAESKHY